MKMVLRAIVPTAEYRVDRTLILTIILLLTGPAISHAKEHSRFVTAQMLANVLANAKKYDWAKQQQPKDVNQDATWLSYSDEKLWTMVTSQELPRTVYTNKGIIYEGQKPHCPNCGEDAPKKIGGRDWWQIVSDQPWKLRCRNCKEIYPKNDFEAFYKSALDEHGFYRRALGDRSLLFNTEHPDANNPLHKLYVDDGYGMFDEKGDRHDIVAAYNQTHVWRPVELGISILSKAYALSSDNRYAHKAAVLLDRVADVYPEMDYLPLHKLGFQHSQGGTGRGRIEGCIWETFVTERIALAYDIIFDGIQNDTALIEFCSNKAKQYKLGDKSSIAAICKHFEDHFLREALSSVKDGRIAGNTGMTHTSLAVNAIALDDPELTGQWLDWMFDPA